MQLQKPVVVSPALGIAEKPEPESTQSKEPLTETEINIFTSYDHERPQLLLSGPSTVGPFSDSSPIEEPVAVPRRKTPVPRLDLTRVFEVQQLQVAAQEEQELQQKL